MTTLQVDFKVVLLGSSNVGKTSLFERFLHNSFATDSKTDTAGQERFESLSKLYFRKASAAIICFIDLISSKENWDVPREQVDNFTNKNNIKTFETSAKEGIGINNLFGTIAQDYLKRNNNEDFNSLNLTKPNTNSNCCQ
ncbi:ras-related protein rab-24 [Anaeramoeba flamelloides]|uniref:Ras-related protein rab-24 n=1 Tax=Anaeramoeba flamelloides TaxID=1746091 RepID=A0AAV7Z1S7_9EUKA|nr:ras-related protein rab-24 [Anaeramoeba flamelloides]